MSTPKEKREQLVRRDGQPVIGIVSRSACDIALCGVRRAHAADALVITQSGTKQIARRLGRVLAAHGLKLATAESCTGGLVAQMVTSVPGSSKYFLGGVVVYANSAKMRLLGVSCALLNRKGAVSSDVAERMAEGARRMFCADIGVGVTGIAGPGGGTCRKPVGLVYIAWRGPGRRAMTVRGKFAGGRTSIRKSAANVALAGVIQLAESMTPKRKWSRRSAGSQHTFCG